MTKTELIAAMAKETGFTKKDLTSATEAMLKVITDELVKGGEVGIMGFGKFYTIDKPEREGTNPQNGEKIKIAASRSVKFKYSPLLKEALN